MTAVLGGAFADPARDAARGFRRILDALSRPGRAVALEGAVPPEGVCPAAGVLALALMDSETPLWLPQRLVAGPVADWLRFHANAPFAPPERAAFAIGRWEELLPLSRWPIGTAENPHLSATLVVEVPALTGGPCMTLSGPGIDGTREAAPVLPAGAAEALAQNAAQGPLGLDVFLVAGGEVMGLPRSTRIGGS